MRGVAKKQPPEGSRRGLVWATGAFAAGALLNVDRVPSWVPVAALLFVVWRLMAATRSLRLPGVIVRSLLALLLVSGAMLRAGRSLLFALPLAVMLFVFFPRLPGAFWAIPRSDEALTGLGDTMSPGSISQLTASYEVAFRAQFDGAPPP